ncbi:MAG: (5-formylfuran-3-yl)methyl phosphate synthase [Candidatus Bathyarchaeia archaeon]
MKLLVSVVDEHEALEAIKGGADILDVKNPREGSLGANFPWIIERVKRVAIDVEVSATLGDLPNLPGTAALAAFGAACSDVDYVKAGLYGSRNFSEATELMVAVCKAAKGYRPKVKVVASGYGDYKEIGCISPLDLPAIAYKAECDGILVDLKLKDGRRLFDFLDTNELNRLAAEAHDNGLTVALAGSLSVDDIAKVWGIGADIIGVRGAVCTGRDRVKGVVDRRLVAMWAQKMKELNVSNCKPAVSEGVRDF